MDYANPEALVETAWLEEHLAEVKVVDGAMIMGGDSLKAFEESHIPGAVHFNINDICAKDTDLPHMIPSAETFASKVGKLGIGNGDRVVVYDASGGAMAACRVWWLFRLFGHTNVALLNGGMAKWRAENRPTENGPAHPAPQAYKATFHPELVRTVEQIAANLESKTEQVVDARSEARFIGDAAEPRATERQGHIPGSFNLPFAELLDRKDATFVSADRIRDQFYEAEVDTDKPIATTCGSGVTACVLNFGLYLIGKTDVPVYDGSWAEWNLRGDLPIE